MKEFKYVIKDSQGIHARPAGELVKIASGYTCSITIIKDGKEVSAKKIFSIMSLGIKQGEEIIVRADGEKESEAIETLEKLMTEKF